MFHCILNNRKNLQLTYSTDPRLDKLTYYQMFFIQWSNFMFQLYKNIQTDFLGQIFLELFQFKTQSFFGTPSIYCQIQHFPPGVKILESKSNRKN